MRKFDGEIVYVRDFILGRDRSTSILYTRRYLKKRLSDIYEEYVKDYEDKQRRTNMLTFDEFKNQFYMLTGYTSRRVYRDGKQFRVISEK